MIYRIQYFNEIERNKIISENQGKFLIEEQNLFEGNFLIFSDKPLPEKVIYTQVPKEELDISKQRITDLELTIAELITHL